MSYENPLANTVYDDSEKGLAAKLSDLDNLIEGTNRDIHKLSSWLDNRRMLDNEIDRFESVIRCAEEELQYLRDIALHGVKDRSAALDKRNQLLEEKRKLQLHGKMLQLQKLTAEINKLQDGLPKDINVIQ